MVTTTGVPLDSGLQVLACDADFCDGFEVGIGNDNRSALYWYLDFASRTPKWIDFLMSIRNFAVGFFHLKNVGRLSDVPLPAAAENLRTGDRVGIFTIRSISDKEVLLEIIDTHLDVVLSVYRECGNFPKIKVITMVFNHNVLGRLYMLPVAPLHKVIVRAILSNHDRLMTRNT